MKLLKRYKIIPLALAFLFLFFAPQAQAEDATVSLSISPAIINQKQEPGTSKADEITLHNTGTEAIALKVYAENFTASNETGGMSFNTDDTAQYSARSWIEIQNPNLVIDPGSSKKVAFDIAVPADAEPGGHYAVLFFEPIPGVAEQSESNVSVSQRVGALIFLTVSGDMTEQGQVLGATASDKCSGVQCSFKTAKFREWGPVPFEFRFENTGSVHVLVSGKIEIFNIFGVKVAELPIDSKTVLPGSTRLFEAKWLREPLLGLYKAKLSINYGTSNLSQTATISFWAFPWKLAVIILFVVLIFVVLFRIIYFRKKKRKSLTRTL